MIDFLYFKMLLKKNQSIGIYPYSVLHAFMYVMTAHHGDALHENS